MKNRKLSSATKKKYKLIIDEWFINGFNGTKAYLKYYKNIKEETATANFSRLQNLEDIIKYIDSKRKKISDASHLEHEDIVKELEGFAMLDVTNILNLKTVKKTAVKLVEDEEATKKAHEKDKRRTRPILKEEEYFYYEQVFSIKDFDELTDLQRRAITSVKQGQYGIEVKFFSKDVAFEMLNKHKGFYEVDNRQKQAVINITAANEKHKKIIDEIIKSK